MKPRILNSTRLSLPLASAIAALIAISAADAATLYWDGVTSTNNADGGNGTWDNAATNWDSVAFGGTDVAWTSADVAFFGPTPAATSTTVTLGEAITAAGTTFNTSGYTVTGSTLTFGGVNHTVALNLAATGTTTINSAIGASAANMTFTAQNRFATHTLNFGGASAGGWSGTTTVNGGVALVSTSNTPTDSQNLVLKNTSGITLNGSSITVNRHFVTPAAENYINDTAAITVNGGSTLNLASATAGDVLLNETLHSLVVNSGLLSLSPGNGTGGSSVTVANGIARATRAAIGYFSTTGLTGPNTVTVTGAGTTSGWTSGAASNSILSPAVTLGTTVGLQNDYAVYAADVVTAANTIASGESTWTDASKQYTVNSGTGGLTLTGTRNIAALRSLSVIQTGAATSGNANFTLVGHTYAVGDAVVMPAGNPTGFTAGQTYFVVAVGTDTLQLSATAGGTAITPTSTTAPAISAVLLLGTDKNLGTTGILNGATATLNISATDTGVVTLPSATSGNLFVNTGSGVIRINPPITNNGAGILTLVKNGNAGTAPNGLILNGANTFTGGIHVNSGAVILNGSNTFATGAVGADVINGGSITYSTIASWGGTGRDVTFNGTGTLTSTVGGYTGGTLNLNTGANGLITLGSGISFATTTGAGSLTMSSAGGGSPVVGNLGNALDLTGTIQLRLTGNHSGVGTSTIQFSALGEAPGSALQFVAGNSDSNQILGFAYNGTSALTFDQRQVQLLDRLTGNWEQRDSILANNSTGASNTWTINTDLVVTGGRGGNQTTRQFILSGTNTGSNAFNGVISNGTNTAGIGLSKTGAGTWSLGANNTYTGVTNISAGVLQITKLANGGSSSSIGASSNANTNLLFGSGATLRYLGSGDSTDRAIRFTSNVGGTGFNLDSSGAGAVNFTSTAAITNSSAAQERFFALTGTNTGENTLAAQITNNTTSPVNLAKNGTGKWVLTNTTSSFTGGMFINDGTLSVAALADSTASSPIGAGTTIGLGRSNANATLLYTGAGNSTNRPIRLGTPNTFPGTGGGSIINDGTGALTFSAATFNTAVSGLTGAANSQNRTLTFGGSYTGAANQVQGAIVNNTATIGLVNVEKTGASTWVFSGANAYTGTTSINSGKLLINGDQTLASGTVTVGALATLGGTGTVGGDVTVANTGRLEFDFSTAPGTHDKMDLAAAKTLSFGANAAITITSASGASTGLYTLVTAPGGVGTLPAFSVTLPVGWTADPPTISGNDLVINITSTGGGGSAYSTWASVNATSGVPADDFDGDGVSNALEFVLGGLASTRDLNKLPVVAASGGNLTFTFVRDQTSITPAAATTIEVGTTLASWPTTFTVGTDTAASSAGVVVTKDTPSAGKDTIVLTVAQAPDAKKFARLKVVVVP